MANKGKGAKPPSRQSWQMGKTAASIKFVKDAELYVQVTRDLVAVRDLNKAIKWIKDGSLVLTNEKTPQEFLDEAA